MKQKKFIGLISISYLLLSFFVSSPAIASDVAVTEFTVFADDDSGGSGDSYPDIYNEYVVWQKDGGIKLADIANIYSPVVYDVSNRGTNPKIYGNIITWSYDYNIYYTDISNPASPIEYQLTDNIYEKRDPVIYNNYIVWTDKRNGNFDIYLADITNPEVPIEYQITSNIGDQYIIDIHGNNVVFQNDPSGDLWIADISNLNSPIIEEVSQDAGILEHGYLSISTSYIAWFQSVARDTICYYDITAKKQTNIQQLEITSIDYLDSWGDKIVIADYEFGGSGNSSIYLYDISKDILTRIRADVAGIWGLAFHQNNIVWEDYGLDWGGSGDILGVMLTYPDTTPPTYQNIPGDTRVVNLTNNEIIKTNPYIIKVKPSDDVKIDRVEFYVDDVLICTETAPDELGVFSCSWDTSKYHSDIRVVTYDTSGNSTELNRTVTVDSSIYTDTEEDAETLPKTGMNILDYLNLTITKLLDFLKSKMMFLF